VSKPPKTATWKELRVEIHPSLAEAAANFLIEQGSPGITQEDVKGGGPKREALIAYFPGDRSFDPLKKKVAKYLESISKSRHTSFLLKLRTIRQEKWAEAWKENFKPIRVSNRLVIKPPWESWPAQKGEIVVEIDPGMAFGTGTHPSTQMCLQLLDEMIPSFSRKISLLDVGTGSGILAIAARKLGVQKILAVDTDPVALENARANARANRIKDGVLFRAGSIASSKHTFDLVVANLLPQEILGLAGDLPRCVAPGGLLILSGLLVRQKKEIAGVFARHGFAVVDSRKAKGWAALVLERINAPEKRAKVRSIMLH